jgi:hypothetical protein
VSWVFGDASGFSPEGGITLERQNSIFLSRGEMAVFRTVEPMLPDGWRVFPQLPISVIVKATREELSHSEWEVYLKSSIDSVLVDQSGGPIMGVEFDGLAEGYSRGDEYIPQKPCQDRYRKLKLDFKIRLCRQVGVPLIVISSEELQRLPGDDHVVLLRGIIGQFLGYEKYKQQLRHWEQAGKPPNNLDPNALDPLLALKLDAEWENDPFRLAAESYWDIMRSKHLNICRENLFSPSIQEAMSKGVPYEAFGCRCTISGESDFVPVYSMVWVRNFAGDELRGVLSAETPVSHGINPLRVAESVATFLALRKAASAEILGTS